MKVVNKSRKIISIQGEPLLPGDELKLTDEMKKHPSIIDYLAKKILVDADNVISDVNIYDAEKIKIEEAAIARYIAEQEKAEEIKTVKNMKKKDELFNKAAGLGIEISDDDTADIVREKILTALAR